MLKQRVFVGSSVEGIAIAYAVQDNLRHFAETTVWDQGIFKLSQGALESLMEVLDSSDFGVFIFSPDDYLTIRGKKDLAVRDNVIFELGLFIGKLGRKKCFILTPDNKEFHLPSDLIGVTPAKFESNRSDSNLQAATGSACNKIREAMGKFPISNVQPNEPELKVEETTKPKESERNWFGLVREKKFDEAIDKLKKMIRKEKDEDEKIDLKSWICYVEYKKDPVKGRKEFEKIIQQHLKSNLPYLRYSQTLAWSSNQIEAITVAERGLNLCERKIGLTIQKAECLEEINKQDVALQLLKDSSVTLDDAAIIVKLADLQIKSGFQGEAINLLNTAFRKFPTDIELLHKFAGLAYDLKLHKLSVVIYRKLTNLEPASPISFGHLGNCYTELDLFNLALISYEKANELAQGKQGWILSNIGNSYSNKEFYDKAENFLKASYSVDSNSEYTLRRLSEVQKSKDEESKKLNEILKTGLEMLSMEEIVVDLLPF